MCIITLALVRIIDYNIAILGKEYIDNMIIFEKLEPLLKAKGKNYYSLRKDKVVGTETIKKLQKKEQGKHIDTRTINALCEYLECQPSDFMEYKEGQE